MLSRLKTLHLHTSPTKTILASSPLILISKLNTTTFLNFQSKTQTSQKKNSKTQKPHQLSYISKNHTSTSSTNTDSEDDFFDDDNNNNIGDGPWYSHARRKMQEPIKTGRKWNESSNKKPGTLFPEEIEDPFEGRALPFGRKVVFENVSEHELAKGKYWIAGLCDRFSEFQDYDIIERGWAGYDFYKIPYVYRQFDGMLFFCSHIQKKYVSCKIYFFFFFFWMRML